MKDKQARKDLVKEYQQIKPKMGVFQIRNTVNDKIFVDSSMKMDSKWNRHQTELQFRTHRNKALQEAWNEDGKTNFVFEVLAELDHEEGKNINYRKELKVLEKMYLEELSPFDEKGYNIRKKR